MKYVEHEERPKALNDLGKKIQLVLKVIEAHRNKVLGVVAASEDVWWLQKPSAPEFSFTRDRTHLTKSFFFNEELPVEDSKTFKIWGFHLLDFPETML